MKLTAQQIEDGIYEIIRLKLVELGYLPDVTAYLPNNTANQAAYKAAIEAIKGTGKKIIEIHNDGSYKNRQNVKENVIIISKEDQDPSVTGTKSSPEYVYDAGNTNYKKSITAETIFDLQYRVTIICYDSEYINIIEDILLQSLGARRKINALEPDGTVVGDFWILIGSYINLDSSKFAERAQMYNIPTINLIGNTDAGTVARAEEIFVGVSTDPDNSNPDDPVDILVKTDESL